MKTLVSAGGFMRRSQPTLSFRSLELPGAFNFQGIRIGKLHAALDNAFLSVKKFVKACINDAVVYKSADNKVRPVFIQANRKFNA